jgi:hypothetical protein
MASHEPALRHRSVTGALLVLAAACSTAPSGVAATASPTRAPALRVPGPLSARTASYRIDAALDPRTHRLTGRASLYFLHGGSQPLESICLHLYMNGFRAEGSLFQRGRRIRVAPDDAGRIDLASVRLAGGPDLLSDATVGPDSTVLSVPLPRAAEPGESIDLAIDFTTRFPRAIARTGHRGDFLVGAQWFPKIGVLTRTPAGDRWVCEPLHAHGEFFADFGVYDVNLTVPRDLTVVATGVLTAVEPAPGGGRTWRFRAEDVHDFAWVADRRFDLVRATVDGDLEIGVYYPPHHHRFAARHLAAATRAVAAMTRWFGRYPWRALTVVVPPAAAAPAVGGMEYPTLVLVNGDSLLAPEGVRLAEYSTVHEVVHQWFQGMVQSDEVAHPWLDEGITEYVTGLILDDWFGADRSAVELAGLRGGHVGLRRALFPLDRAVLLTTDPASAAPDLLEAFAVGYVRPQLALTTVERAVGRDRLIAALARYFRAQAFRHPGPDDLFAALEAELGAAPADLLRRILATTEVPDYQLRDVVARPIGPGAWRSDVMVGNSGLALATEVEVRFADGLRQRSRWDGAGAASLSFTGTSPVIEAAIDPDGDIAIERRRIDNARRRPSARASARAGSALTFLHQTLLQVVGP